MDLENLTVLFSLTSIYLKLFLIYYNFIIVINTLFYILISCLLFLMLFFTTIFLRKAIFQVIAYADVLIFPIKVEYFCLRIQNIAIKYPHRNM